MPNIEENESLPNLEARLDFIWRRIKNTPEGDEQNALRGRYDQLVADYNLLSPESHYQNPGTKSQ